MGEDKEKQGEQSLKDEIQIRIRNLGTGDGGRVGNRQILDGLQDLAKVVYLSSQLIANEIKLLTKTTKDQIHRF